MSLPTRVPNRGLAYVAHGPDRVCCLFKSMKVYFRRQSHPCYHTGLWCLCTTLEVSHCDTGCISSHRINFIYSCTGQKKGRQPCPKPSVPTQFSLRKVLFIYTDESRDVCRSWKTKVGIDHCSGHSSNSGLINGS